MHQIPSVQRLKSVIFHATLVLVVLLGASLALPSKADPSVPWSPNAATRHDIELLVDVGGLDLTTTQWPLPAAAVRRALSALPTALPDVLSDARRRVYASLDGAAGAQATVALRGGRETPSGFGDDATSGSFVGARTGQLNSGWYAAQIGVRVDATDADRQDTTARLNDTALALEGWGIQVAAFSHRYWWGPGWQSALALSDNAPPLMGAGIQRASASRSESKWLSWLGPWNAELFVAHGDQGQSSVTPRVVGTRFTTRPFSRLELGFTRTLQWGGQGLNNSLGSLVRVIGGANTNIDDRAVAGQDDAANQLAGLDARYSCGSWARCAFYTEIIGEDRWHFLPKKLIATYGAETWSADGRHRWFVEYTDTECGRPVGLDHVPGCAYRNGLYPGGYAQGNRWLGASVGPDSRLLTFGWLDVQSRQLVKLYIGDVQSRIDQFSTVLKDQPSPTSGRYVAVSAQRSYSLGTMTISPELGLSHLDGNTARRFNLRAGVVLQKPL